MKSGNFGEIYMGKSAYCIYLLKIHSVIGILILRIPEIWKFDELFLTQPVSHLFGHRTL